MTCLFQYQTYVDKHARKARREPEFELKTFYGRLQHLFAVQLPIYPGVGVNTAQTVLLAGITTCNVDVEHPVLDIHFYKTEGVEEIYGLECVQCLIGRVPYSEQRWAIIDRSGALSRAVAE
jgi:hypothetical protein